MKLIGNTGLSKDNEDVELSLCHIEEFWLSKERQRNGLYIHARILQEHADKYPIKSFYFLAYKNKVAKKLKDVIIKHGKIVTHGCNMGSYVATSNTKNIKATHPEVNELFEKEFYRQDAEEMEKQNATV